MSLPTLHIGELAQRSGLSRDTIRFYEKRGLLAPEQRNAANDYKLYGMASLLRLEQIQQLKAVGLTLREVGELLQALDAGPGACTDLPTVLTRKLAELDTHIARLQQQRQTLLGVFNACQGSACGVALGVPACVPVDSPPQKGGHPLKCC